MSVPEKNKNGNRLRHRIRKSLQRQNSSFRAKENAARREQYSKERMLFRTLQAETPSTPVKRSEIKGLLTVVHESYYIKMTDVFYCWTPGVTSFPPNCAVFKKKSFSPDLFFVQDAVPPSTSTPQVCNDETNSEN